MEEKGWPEEYEFEEIKEKYVAIDWIAAQFLGQRPIKTKELFIIGEPCTQKTLLFHLLSKVVKIYPNSCIFSLWHLGAKGIAFGAIHISSPALPACCSAPPSNGLDPLPL